ncbi:hypothetical protein CDL12_28452 [Handroanthus impetiginosus]|uniref:Agenet-like domain-containing protein n=1 Tax=Handroanthus impetiginosus TaxID=429701 RepID=A0A2G9G153_9LAMI|nr:hypothetical protein CDL12_28452 [Handroanthus impetiginosus]
MSDDQVMRAWEERIILREKGRRLVHYILKDSMGNSVLAVVGRDRSVNHMAYEISEDFLCVFGSTSTVHAGTKWRARRDVIEWLVSVVSRGGPILANSTDPSSRKCQFSGQSNNRKISTEEVEASTPEELAKRAFKRMRSCRMDQTLLSSFGCLPNLVSHNLMVRWEPTRKRLKIKASTKGPVVSNLVMPGPRCRVFSKINKNIELLSQDSSMQGCWFRCKILCSSENRLKVQYMDVLEVDGPGKLEEWVPAPRVAPRDKLGVRCLGRLTIRPWPSEDSSDVTFEVGASVDAWWCNGWFTFLKGWEAKCNNETVGG